MQEGKGWKVGAIGFGVLTGEYSHGAEKPERDRFCVKCDSGSGPGNLGCVKKEVKHKITEE